MTSLAYRVVSAANTYDWITATADSRISRRICVNRRNETIVWDREGPVPLRRVRIRWPASMLAASRIANVPGRITFLTVSISTIRGMSNPGVPVGTR